MQEISRYLEDNLKKSISLPIWMIQKCNKCSFSLNVYNPYINKKSMKNVTCPNCKELNNLEEASQEDDWTFPEGQTSLLLEDMCNEQIIIKETFGSCYKCNITNKISLTKNPINLKLENLALLNYLNELYCPKCRNIYDVYSLYTMNNNKDTIFWKQGYWLEWYVKKLCEEGFSKSIIEQGVILTENTEKTEIDVLLYKSKKTYGIECKCLSPYKKANINDLSDILNCNNLVDFTILVTTSNIDKKAKKTLEKNDIIIIENDIIENISTILKKY